MSRIRSGGCCARPHCDEHVAAQTEFRRSCGMNLHMASSAPDTAPDSELLAFLEACAASYEHLVEQLDRLVRSGTRPEAILTWIEMTAGFAATHHAGRFADGAVENAALTLGADLRSSGVRAPRGLSRREPTRNTRKSRQVLHVATVAMSLGGHTKTIINWIHKDDDSRHSLLLTRQGMTPIPPELLRAIANSGGQVFSFPDTAPITDRASWLRELAPQHGDVVILHLIPDDVVPIVAFADRTRVPIAQVNLADQCFWLGSTVADSTLNLRDVSASINEQYRFTRNEQLVPIPLALLPPTAGRDSVRASLGIPESYNVLLSVGRAVKYAPSRRQSFFQTAAKILDENPQAHLYLVGVSASDHAGSHAFACHERMHLLGTIPDPTAYQYAADVYLEGFPFGSQTALLESVVPGNPCVRAIAPLSPVLAASDVAIEGIAPVPADEREYVALADGYLSDLTTRRRIGQELRESVMHYHVGPAWKSLLEQAYGRLATLPHAPAPIPTTGYSADQVDLAISEYHGTRYSGVDPRSTLDRVMRGGIFGSAYVLRQRGAYADALRLVRMTNGRQWWRDRRVLAFTAKLLPHKLLSKAGILHP